MKVITLCFQIEALNKGKWDQETLKLYPGSGWIPYFVQDMALRGVIVSHPEETQDWIESKRVNPKEVHVVSEEGNLSASKLIYQGCIPFLIFCLESPLFVPYFYDNIDSYKTVYPYQMLFGDLGNIRLYFPSFDANDVKQTPPWNERKKHACMVISNKHSANLRPFYKDSPSFEKYFPSNLHDLRMNVVNDSKSTGIDIYGKGWAEFPEIPPGEKIKVLEQYKFNVCLENLQMEGYVTEKIFDCLIAGCIPIYNKSSSLLPYDIFFRFLEQSDEIFPYDFKSMQLKGQLFLISEEGLKFSYQSFSKKLENLFNKIISVNNTNQIPSDYIGPV